MNDETCTLHGIAGLAPEQREIVCDEPTYRVGTTPCKHPQPLCFGHYSLVPLMSALTCEKCGNKWPIEVISWAPLVDDDGEQT